MHGQSTCAVSATEPTSQTNAGFQRQRKVGMAVDLSPCRLTGQPRAVPVGVSDCGAMTAWLCSHNCSLQPRTHGVWEVLCLPLHYSIAIPGNMAKKMGMLLWMENRQYNSI